MNFNLDSFMIIVVGALIYIGKVIKDLCPNVKIFGKKITKFLPIILLIPSIIIEVVYALTVKSATDPMIAYILKAAICTAVACWGFDAVKGATSKGISEEEK